MHSIILAQCYKVGKKHTIGCIFCQVPYPYFNIMIGRSIDYELFCLRIVSGCSLKLHDIRAVSHLSHHEAANKVQASCPLNQGLVVFGTAEIYQSFHEHPEVECCAG